jgi:hypothetical protein
MDRPTFEQLSRLSQEFRELTPDATREQVREWLANNNWQLEEYYETVIRLQAQAIQELNTRLEHMPVTRGELAAIIKQLKGDEHGQEK